MRKVIVPSIPGGMGISLLSLPPVPGIINLKSGEKAASISDSLPLFVAAMHLSARASLSALVDIVDEICVRIRERCVEG